MFLSRQLKGAAALSLFKLGSFVSATSTTTGQPNGPGESSGKGSSENDGPILLALLGGLCLGTACAICLSCLKDKDEYEPPCGSSEESEPRTIPENGTSAVQLIEMAGQGGSDESAALLPGASP